VLSLKQIGKSFGPVRALHAVDLDLAPGEVHALVGENGAGKSTLLRILTGGLAPDTGTLAIGGERCASLTPLRARALGIAVVHQHPALLHELSVAENLLFGSDGAWISWKARRTRARELLSAVGATIDPDAIAGALPLPAQQLVQIARALREEPRILVLDEPTAVLPENEAQRLLGLVRNLRARGTAVLYVTHRLEELPQLADRVSVLRDGERVWTSAMSDVTPAELIRHMVGRPPAVHAPRADSALGPEVLSLEQLDSAEAGLRNITLSLRSGEILGLAGLVGAGRTELAECLFGLRRIDSGRVRLRGQLFAPRSPADAIARGLVLVPEDRRRHGVIPEMTLAENLTLPNLREFARSGLLDARAESAAASQAVAEFGVRAASVEAPLATLSGGNQQKIALARWLRHRPAVLLLDEPTQGIDVAARAEIHERIRAEAAAGCGVLLVSSDLPELFLLADRIAVLRQGRLAGVLPRAGTSPEAVMALCVHGER